MPLNFQSYHTNNQSSSDDDDDADFRDINYPQEPGITQVTSQNCQIIGISKFLFVE